MKAWTDKLASFSPPLWLTMAMASVVAAALLAAFVATLNEHVRRGNEFRLAQAHANVRHPALQVVADASQARPVLAVQLR